MSVLLITSNRLGDAVLTTGAVPYLTERHPAQPLVVACGPLPAPLFEAMPHVATVWALPKRPLAGHWRGLWQKTVRRQWQHVVDLRGSAFAYAVRAKQRTVMRPDTERRHRVLHLTQTLGAARPLSPRLHWRKEHGAEADWLLDAHGSGAGPLLAIGPTANWIGKQWQADRFAAVACALTAVSGALPDARVLVAGARGEEAAAAPLLEALPPERTVAAFGWPLPVLAAALARTTFYIGNDSGLMHIAAAVGVPTIGLFGPSRPELYAPWGPNGRVVRTATSLDEFVNAPGYDHRTTGSLMGEITVEQVLRTAGDMLKARACASL